MDFRQRTDALAVRLGVRLADLPERLSISRASLFGYRSDRLPISNKAWQKLAQVEREVGLAPPLSEQIKFVHPSAQSELLETASLPEILNLLPEDRRISVARAFLDTTIFNAELLLHGFFSDSEALANLIGRKKPRRADLLYFARAVRESVNDSRDFTRMLVNCLKAVLNTDAEGESLPGPIAPKIAIPEKKLAKSKGEFNLPTMRQSMPRFDSWEEIQIHLRQALSSRGSKARLARQFGLTTQAVSQWLRKAKPPAEVAFRLRKMLLDGSLTKPTQQKKSAGSATTRPTPRTQEGKSTVHEKSKSDQSKS